MLVMLPLDKLCIPQILPPPLQFGLTHIFPVSSIVAPPHSFCTLYRKRRVETEGTPLFVRNRSLAVRVEEHGPNILSKPASPTRGLPISAKFG
jgi:hypothetical protein